MVQTACCQPMMAWQQASLLGKLDKMEPPPAVVAMNMGTNGLEMQARPFVKYEDYDPVQFGFRQQITEQLTAAGIEPAVQQRDVRLDSLE